MRIRGDVPGGRVRCQIDGDHGPHTMGSYHAGSYGVLCNICPGHGPEAGRVLSEGSALFPSIVEVPDGTIVPHEAE